MRLFQANQTDDAGLLTSMQLSVAVATTAAAACATTTTTAAAVAAAATAAATSAAAAATTVGAATTAAATTAAATAVGAATTAATATAVTTTAAAAVAATTTATGTTAAAATKAARTLFARTCFIDNDGAAFQSLTIHAVDGGLRFCVRPHLDKAEAFGTTSVPVHHHFCRCDCAKLRKCLIQRIITDRIGKITYVQFVSHGEPLIKDE